MLKKIFRKLNKHSKNQIINSKGNLVVPEGAQVIDGEPAVLHMVKLNKPKYLFITPPKFKKSDYAEITGKVTEIHKEMEINKVKYPARYQLEVNLESKHGNQESIFAEMDFVTTNKKGEIVPNNTSDKEAEVVAREFEYVDPATGKTVKHPHLLQVCTFEKISRQKPQEENRVENTEFEYQIKHLGYMFKEDVKKQQYFQKTKENIFPHPPTKEEVAQAGMRDCFLLATINAILERKDGAQYIMNMMSQQEDGSVIVRLFHPITGEPEYVKVENSYHKEVASSLVSHKAPWIHILEKAYAGYGFIQKQESIKTLQEKGIKGYQILEKKKDDMNPILLSPQTFLNYTLGGQPEFACKILTGQDAENINILYQLINPLDSDNLRMLTSNVAIQYIYPHIYDENNKLKEFNEDIRKDIIKSLTPIDKWCHGSIEHTVLYEALVNNQDPSALIDWTIYINILKIYHPKEYEKLKLQSNGQPPLYETPKNSEEWLTLLNSLTTLSPSPPDNAIAAFVNYVSNPKETQLNGEITKTYSVPGKIGSGKYDYQQYKLFETLFDLHQTGHVLMAATHEKFAEDDQDSGLVTKHAYSILNVFKKNVNGKELLFIRLRNPWPHTGRTYEIGRTGELIGKYTEKNEFDLEINDFLKYFTSYSVGTIPNLTQIQEKLSTQRTTYREKEVLTFSSFSKLATEQQQDFLNKLHIKNKYDCKQILSRQSMEDIYQIHTKLEDNIKSLGSELKKAKRENQLHKVNDIKQLTDEKNKVLSLLKSEFKSRLKANPTYLTIKQDAKLYLKKHKPHLFNQIKDSLKRNLSKLISIFNKQMTPDYIKMYGYHKAYQQEKIAHSYFLKSFSSLDDRQKQHFVTQLLKENDEMKKQILNGQSISDLTQIAARVKPIETLINNQINAIPILISHTEINSAKGYEIEEMAKLYLKDNPSELAALKIDSAPQTIRDVIFKNNDKGKRCLQVIGETHEHTSKLYQIDERQIIEFASRHFAATNRKALQFSSNDNEYKANHRLRA